MLTHLEADGLRNLKSVRLELPAGLTLIGGRNGQGKTSLLEAAFLLSTGRSFRTRRHEELVRRDGDHLKLDGRCIDRQVSHRLGIRIGRGERHLLLDGAESDLENYLGHLVVVDLTAARMDVLRAAPDERRRFIDRGALGLRPGYLRTIADYRRSLLQRNTRLRHGAGRELDAWDIRLRDAAIALHLERRSYADKLTARLEQIAPRLLPDGRKMELAYRPSPAEWTGVPRESLAAPFDERLARARPRDLALGYTTVGPHRDELSVKLDAAELRRFGSAGQLRAGMIALKLSKLAVLREERGEAPLFLMDDFDTDLDEARMAALAEYLQSGGFQAIVATSKASALKGIGGVDLKLRMDEGVARSA